MMNSWKKLKRSGSYHRDLKKYREDFEKRASEIQEELDKKRIRVAISNNHHQQIFVQNQNCFAQAVVPPSNISNSSNLSADSASPVSSSDIVGSSCSNDSSCAADNTCVISSDDEDESDDEITRNQNLRVKLKAWALKSNISHMSLKDLLQIFNDRFGKDTPVLPTDPRTFLQTPQNVSIRRVGNGDYWHHGLVECLQIIFRNLSESTNISLNVNIDGLLIPKSSKVEFWPILFNIFEMPKVPPMVIGIFCGKAKASDLESFLAPFVDEMKEISANGLHINSHKLTVRLRCFICDAPARAYVKGVANFNGQHGCLKCTTIGEYSYANHTNVFPRAECVRRSDENFREKLYGSHHKIDSPLLRLDIDMIEQFPVGDSLHLLHLGVMKRLLFGWRDGTFRNSKTKWPAATSNAVSEFLDTCKMPTEFHRVVRGLDCLAHWKGTEYRTFPHYLSIVALKDHLQHDIYEHFLLLFVAVTICSSKKYFKMLHLARMLLNQYIEIFKEIYGKEYVTSNVHNLTHLVEEVERFGELETFSAYPFENALGKIKRFLRSGNRPLAQVARRIVEGISLNDSVCQIIDANTSISHIKKMKVVTSKGNDGGNIPEKFKSTVDGEIIGFYSKIDFGDEYCLSATDLLNCWFLTNLNEIACVKNIIVFNTDVVKLFCSVVDRKENFFEIPIESRYLDIYCTHRSAHTNNCKMGLISCSDIKCKLVRVKYHETDVFLPVLHTKAQ